MTIAFEDKMRAGGAAALEEMERFFGAEEGVYTTLKTLVRKLDGLGISHAVAGEMALVAHGCFRARARLEILVTPAGKKLVLEKLSGCGFLRRTANVPIEFWVTGEFPGGGRAGPIVFPDPTDAAVEIDGIAYLRLEKLIELKLASGMTNPNRLKDLADVQELIRVLKPGRSLGDGLHEFVRGKFFELWDGLDNEVERE